MRPRTAAALAATTVLGAGTAAVAAGRYAGDAALSPSRPLPSDPRLTVHATTADTVTLTRSLASLRPGTYGLTGGGVHAVIGDVAEDTDCPPDSVVRRLVRVERGGLRRGAKVRFTPQVHTGNPGEAHGLEYEDVEVPGELGPLPAWLVPGTRSTWVVTAHGLGTTREHPMVVMPFLSGLGIPVLDLSYRGDPGAPRDPDGTGHLGDTEWRDLDAAVRFAVHRGAERVVLHGWSTGGSMAVHTVANSALRDRISGLVLDSPVLDWHSTVRALAAAHGTPRALLPLAVRAAEGRAGLGAESLAEASAPSRVSVPTLILHGPDDRLAPWDRSQLLAERRPDLVTLHAVPEAPHAAMWNAGPAGYEEALRRFLTALL
ncbi:S9 family peptidase [Streptomyces sp. WAC 00631]|uniref:alpha/beta hydrolase n=1 Tax=unclassified Streptomyces TaxID=2593676 RepID=UPI000F79AF3E|nr:MULTISPECIES: prolyl oligopeptidase family serine peptidase [unclassified Streptomyces]MCC5034376.1 S9 family peptidase [Streptomyces sp. WAC 00631]MCC9742249.1 S9 family peptidase [Streptomyces sp. MNU89]